MLFAISVLSYGLSAVEFLGYGHVLQVYLDRLRVRSMQIAMRDGEINPKLSEFIVKVAGYAFLFFFAVSLVVTAILLPTVLIFGKEAASNLISGKWAASVLGLFTFGPLLLVVGIGALYVVWCVLIDLVSKALGFAHQSRQGIVAMVSFAIGTLSFALDRLF